MPRVTLHLFRRETLFRVYDERHSLEPNRQRQMAFVEYRSRSSRELKPAGRLIALVEATGRNARFLGDVTVLVACLADRFVGDEFRDIRGTAGQTTDTFRPARGFQIVEAGVRSAEKPCKPLSVCIHWSWLP